MPAANTAWPPKQYSAALKAVRHDDAIMSGDVAYIRASWEGRNRNAAAYTHRSQYNGGIVGKASRAVLGRPQASKRGELKISRHIGLADDLITSIVSFMAEKPPRFTLHDDDSHNERAQDFLTQLGGSDSFASDWWNAVYKTSGLGWNFGRVVWNTDVHPHPWIEWVDADQAVCEFQWGRQQAIIFWESFEHPENNHLYRLLERHTAGSIEYALYEGSNENIGMRVPFTEHPATEYLANLDGLTDGNTIETGIDLSTAHMMVNHKARWEWRNHPQLRYYSASDVSLGGGLWADVDRIYSQLIEEIDSARGRLYVPERLLELSRPGEGMWFDNARDVFPVGDTGNVDESQKIEQVQFQMRIQQYADALHLAKTEAVDALGLSPMTVGMEKNASGQMTATETKTRQRRTLTTAGSKQRHQRDHLSHIMTAAVNMDAMIHGYPPLTQLVQVAMPDPIVETEQEEAEVVATQVREGIGSTEWAVRRLRKEWTEDQIQAELERLREDRQAGSPIDPLGSFSFDSSELSDDSGE
ncbi:hypothetical protein QP905_08250 [Corynebacterium pseudodiphtheriticum]|uniref:hypothetical protein n=1 Tax=Corynebacterium pseudodiphtheriticum TaxID=37637 RepID=UPI00254F63DF|nr:hypothetical protein [Corynebacterium pseudodiphtheriticum]MDK8578336.1 hypothetical protein [Corynebacterium pseudodiphtheriticum]